MRMLMEVRFPHEPFNSMVLEGTAGKTIEKILDVIKPEAVYFTERGGWRGVILIVDVDDPSKVPFLAEPFFISFDADVEFHIVMSPDDLGRANLTELGQQWA